MQLPLACPGGTHPEHGGNEAASSQVWNLFVVLDNGWLAGAAIKEVEDRVNRRPHLSTAGCIYEKKFSNYNTHDSIMIATTKDKGG